jgi:hypothetical protein
MSRFAEKHALFFWGPVRPCKLAAREADQVREESSLYGLGSFPRKTGTGSIMYKSRRLSSR